MANSKRRLLAAAICLSNVVALALADTPDDQYRVAATLYQRGDWTSASAEFRKFLTEYPDHAQAVHARFYLGEALLQGKKWDEAQAAFQQAVDRDPDSEHADAARFRLGESAYLGGDHAAAKTALGAFVDRAGEHKLRPQAEAYLGEISLAAKDHDRAAEHFAFALSGLTDGAARDRCQFGLALCHEQQGNSKAALAGFRELAGRRDSSLADDAQLGLGRIEYRLARYAEAAKHLAAFDRAWSRSPLRPKADLVHGWALFRLEKYEDAERRFEAAAKDPARAIEARHWLGLAQLGRGKFDDAAKTLADVAEQAKDHPLLADTLYYQGKALAGAKQAASDAAADKVFERLAREFPQSPWVDDAEWARIELLGDDDAAAEAAAKAFLARYPDSRLRHKATRRLARALLARDEFEPAREALEPLLDEDREAGDVDPLATRYLLAHAYQGLKRHADALATLEPLADEEAHPLHGASGLVRAAALASLDRQREAIPILRRYLKKPPSDGDIPAAQAMLAVALLEEGEADASRKVWDEFLAGKPRDALRATTERKLAEAAAKQKQFDWAAELYQKVSQQDEAGAAPAALAGRGWAQFQSGDLEAALSTYRELWERFPDDERAPGAMLTAARIHARQERPDAALALYRRIVEEHPKAEAVRDALWESAGLCDRLEQDQEALSCLERLDREFPNHLDHDAVLYQWSWVLRQLNQPERAARLWERLLEEHPDSKLAPDATYRLAEHAVAEGHLEHAKKWLDKLRAGSVPSEIEPHALWLEGKVAAAERRWADCASAMQRLAQGFPDSSLKLLADYHQAEARYRLGQWAESAVLFDDLSERTLGRDEDWVAMVQLRRAQLKARAEDWAAAQEMAQGLLRRFPEFSQLYEADLLIGRALASQARLTDARRQYEKVIASPTGSKTETAAMAQLFLAESYFHQEDFDAALREYLRLEILYPYPTWQAAALLQAGKCQERLERWSDAAATYARVLEQYPDSAVRAEADNRLQVVRDRTARAADGEAKSESLN